MNNFQSWYGLQPPALRALLTINVGFYILWILVLGRIDAASAFVFEHFALIPLLPQILLEPWQLVTYNFLHLGLDIGGLLHILFNMLWLVWIGREFEQMQGSHKLMAIYLLSGIGGGLLTLLFYAAFPPSGMVFVYGASASVFGVMAAVATFYPYQSIGLLFIGTVRLVYLVLALLAIDILFRMESSTAVTAHIGGALFGFLFARGEKAGMNLSSWARIFFGGFDRSPKRRTAPARPPSTVMSRMEGWLGGARAGGASEKKARPAATHPTRSVDPEVETSARSLQSEVDRILDKISVHGYDALSAEEKRILYDASRR